MKKPIKKKDLRKATKPELIRIIKQQQMIIDDIDSAYRKSVKYSASLRHILKVELLSKKGEWEQIEEQIEFEEFENDEDVPDSFKIPEPPKMKSKKKQIEGMYQWFKI